MSLAWFTSTVSLSQLRVDSYLQNHLILLPLISFSMCQHVVAKLSIYDLAVPSLSSRILPFQRLIRSRIFSSGYFALAFLSSSLSFLSFFSGTLLYAFSPSFSLSRVTSLSYASSLSRVLYPSLSLSLSRALSSSRLL